MEKTEGQPIDNGANPEKAAPVDEGHTSDSDKPPDDIQKPVDHAMPDEEYISGIKLWLVIASVTLVCFLMMLDMSIIVTVSIITPLWAPDFSSHDRPSLASLAISILCPMLAGTAART